jgi:Amt family ammonium transporter
VSYPNIRSHFARLPSIPSARSFTIFVSEDKVEENLILEVKMLGTVLYASAFAFLVPIGLALLAAGGSKEEKAPHLALMSLAAIAIASVGYFACGFAFHYGGIGLVSKLEGLEELALALPLREDLFPGRWVILGLKGFFLSEEAYPPTVYSLFFSQLPLVSTAVLIPLLALKGRANSFSLVLGALIISTAIYPLLGNWAWGGGWLASLGSNLELGHGFVDFAGGGLVNLAGGTIALAGILVLFPRLKEKSEPPRMPAVHLPIFAILGSLLLIIGWLGLSLSNPLYLSAELSPPLIAVNLILAASGGALSAILYSWFTTGKADVLMTARGIASGLVAASASLPFVPPWAALLIGSISGLLLPLSMYFVECVLRLDDQTASISVHGISGLLGLLALAIFADGRYGAGWNGVGAESYLGISGQGVSGIIVAIGFSPDWPGQFYAQIIGIASIFLFAFCLSWPLFNLGFLFKRLRRG